MMIEHLLLDEGAKDGEKYFLDTSALAIAHPTGVKCFSKYLSIRSIGIWLSKNK